MIGQSLELIKNSNITRPDDFCQRCAAGMKG